MNVRATFFNVKFQNFDVKKLGPMKVYTYPESGLSGGRIFTGCSGSRKTILGMLSLFFKKVVCLRGHTSNS